MVTENEPATLTLNVSGVIAPLHQVLERCSNSVLFGLQTLELVHEIPPDLKIDDGFLKFRVGSIEDDIVTKKEKYKTWLLKRGFEDLVKGIEYSLREAYLYVSIFSRQAELRTVVDFNVIFSKIRKDALSMHIPTMMEKIEPHLTKSWSYKEQILSINKSRNCLMHRGGLVAEKDINDKIENVLKLSWVKLKLFYEKGDQEVELIGETIIDAGPEGAQIKIRREENTISFKQGDRIVLNYRQFNEFIVTCFHFGADLAECLPKIKNSVAIQPK